MPAKTIIVSPGLMKMSGGETRKAKAAGGPKKRLHPKTSKSTDALRNKLQRRIKQYQQRAGRCATAREQSKPRKSELVVDTEPSNAFDESLAFLQGLATASRSDRGTQKVAPARRPEPPYGVLKGGRKPTYRQWMNKTRKAPPAEGASMSTPPPPPAPVPPPAPALAPAPVPPRAQVLADIKKERIKAKQKNRRAVRTLGKRDRRVSVLIANNRTRRERQREHGLLKATPIAAVKKFLVEHNLLKVGSLAPNDVLRHMYEEAVMAGKVSNVDKEPLVHNYMNSDKLV